MNVLTPLSKAWDWIKKAFTTIRVSADSVAIAITEEIKVAIDGGAVGFLAKVIDQLTKTKVADTVLLDLQTYIPELLACELAVKGLPDNPTEQDILDFENSIIGAFKIKQGSRSKILTLLAAQIYGRINTLVNATHGQKLTFAQTVSLIDDCYQDYKADVAEVPES